MERREFLTTVAAGSACAVSGAAADAGAQETKKYGVKFTVLRRGYEKELVAEMKTGPKGPCTRFSDGQEFVIQSQWAMPEKFCEWAWADIRT
jgi:hypothetical protein